MNRKGYFVTGVLTGVVIMVVVSRLMDLTLTALGV